MPGAKFCADCVRDDSPMSAGGGGGRSITSPAQEALNYHKIP